MCSLCSNNSIRLSKLDPKKYKVCDQCDTMMSNINFEGMYVSCITKQKETLHDLKKILHKKDATLKGVSK